MSRRSTGHELYPDECPVFELIGDPSWENVATGTIRRGHGPGIGYDYHGFERPCLEVYVPDPAAFESDSYFRECVRRLGIAAIGVMPNGLRPLTPAARDMLALVKGARR